MFLRADAFAAKAFAARFLGASGGGVTPPVVTVDEARPGGAAGKRRSRAEKDTRRRRILLADGSIITPRNDEEYRIIVAEIVSGFGRDEPAPAPKARQRRRIKGAVVRPEAPKTLEVSAVPDGFYEGLEQQHKGVLNYLAILDAWAAWLAEQDEDETISILLVS